MKFFQKRAVAVAVLVLAIVAGVAIGQAKRPDTSGEASTAIVGSYTYVYDYAGVLTDETMEHIDAMNASLFAQTGAQILVDVVNSTGGVDIMEYAADLGNTYGVGSAERNNGVVVLLALGVAGILPPATTALLHNASTMAISAGSMRPYLPALGRGGTGDRKEDLS